MEPADRDGSAMTQQAYPIRCRIRNHDGTGPTRVDVYDDIGGGGWFFGGLTPKDFADQLAGVTGALEVHVSSGGGDVFDGIAIANTIRGYKGPKTTVNDGIAASIASVIFQAGDERVVQPGSMVMIHDAFGAALGNAAEVRKFADTLDQVSDNIAGIYASRAGGTAASWRDAMKEETWYTAEQAVAGKLADRIGDGSAELPAGLDVAAFTSVPGRIAAALRSMPQAPAPVILNADGNHPPFSGDHSHSHTAGGDQGGDATHDHGHSHANDADHGHSHAQDHAGGILNGPGKPYKPAPYTRDADETVQCPQCKKFNDVDAGWCDQCGSKLTGRTDVEETSGPGKTDTDGTGDGGDGAQPGKKAAKKAAKAARLRGGAEPGPCCSLCGPDCACGGQPAARRRIVIVDARAAILGIESMPLANEALPVHHTGTVDKPWDGPAAVAGMPNDAKVLKYCHAWQDTASDDGTGDDPDGDADDKKASYKFPHHTGKGAPANLAACRNGLARLSGASIPDSDRAGVEAHLRAHLKDGGSDTDDAGNHAHPDLSGHLEQIRAALKGAHE